MRQKKSTTTDKNVLHIRPQESVCGETTVFGILNIMSKTKCMNGSGSKYGIHVREWRWTVGVAEYN